MFYTTDTTDTTDTLNVSDVECIENMIKTNELIFIKFDTDDSKYNEFIDKLNFKIINITDKEIIDFYDIDTLPTILIYKNKNLIDSIIGFHTKTILLKKILNLIKN